MFIDLSAFTSRPIFLLANTEAQYVNILQHKPEADAYHLISNPPGLPEPS